MRGSAFPYNLSASYLHRSLLGDTPGISLQPVPFFTFPVALTGGSMHGL